LRVGPALLLRRRNPARFHPFRGLLPDPVAQARGYHREFF
jgi:hypothetical protein